MSGKLNSRQHRFALNILAGMPPQQAYEQAGYSSQDAESNAYHLLTGNYRVAQFIEDKRRLKEAIVLSSDINDTIASPNEVKQVLSEILRGSVFDHVAEDGAVTPNRHKPVAVKEYSHRHRLDHDGNLVVSKELKLESKLEAARELAKMHGMYAPSKHLIGKDVRVNVIHTERKSISDGDNVDKE